MKFDLNNNIQIQKHQFGFLILKGTYKLFQKITMNVIPGKQLEMTQTLLSMIEPTEKEAGCISYGVFCDTKDKNRFCLLEE